MADWFAISLRWIILVGFVVSLGLGDKLEIAVSWPLGLLIAWNLFMTALAGMNIRVAYHRLFSTLVDITLAGLFYWAQGGLRGPAVWAAITGGQEPARRSPGRDHRTHRRGQW